MTDLGTDHLTTSRHPFLPIGTIDYQSPNQRLPIPNAPKVKTDGKTSPNRLRNTQGHKIKHKCILFIFFFTISYDKASFFEFTIPI